MRKRAAVAVVIAVVVALLLWFRDRPEPVAPVPSRPAVPSPGPGPAPRPETSSPAQAPSPGSTAPAQDAAGSAAPLEASPADGLKDWGPKGRVLDRATGEPVYWTRLTYELRLRVTEENAASWSESREPLEPGEKGPDDPGAFDVGTQVRQSPMEPHATKGNTANAEFRVLARAPGFRKAATDWIRRSEYPRDRPLPVEMDRDRPGTLLARVRTAEGAPLRGKAHLDVTDGEEFWNLPPVEADERGFLSFGGLPSGNLRVSVVPECPEEDDSIGLHVYFAASPSRDVVIPPGGRIEAEFDLPRTGEIRIQVTDSSGAPLTAWVTDLKWKRGSSSIGKTVRRILGVGPGDYEVGIWAKGFREWKGTVRVDLDAPARVEAQLVPEEETK